MTKEELQSRIREVEVRNGRARYGRELTEAILKYAAPLLAAGQSQAEIAGDLGIKAWTLQRWHQNAHKAAGSGAALGNKLAFIRLEPARARCVAETPLEVVMSNGRVVRVPVGFDEDSLARVLAVVEGGAR